MNTMLSYKEDSLRKMKETLRKKTQQWGDESCEFARPSSLSGWVSGSWRGGSQVTVSISVQEGKDLHAKLTQPKGRLITSSLSMEKQKLEEEVQQQRMKIVQLERYGWEGKVNGLACARLICCPAVLVLLQVGVRSGGRGQQVEGQSHQVKGETQDGHNQAGVPFHAQQKGSHHDLRLLQLLHISKEVRRDP